MMNMGVKIFLKLITLFVLLNPSNTKTSNTTEEEWKSTELFRHMNDGTYALTTLGQTIDAKLSSFGNLLPIYPHLRNSLLQSRINASHITARCSEAVVDLLIQLNRSHPNKLASLPVVRMLDAWSKIPEKIFIGNYMWIGAYGECKEFQPSKYCWTPMKIKGNPFPGVFASCFPVQCSTEDVVEVTSVVLHEFTSGLVRRDPEREALCDSPVEYSDGAIASAAVLAFVLLLCVIGTILDIVQGYRTLEPDEKTSVGSTVMDDDVENETEIVENSASSQSDGEVDKSSVSKDDEMTLYVNGNASELHFAAQTRTKDSTVVKITVDGENNPNGNLEQKEISTDDKLNAGHIVGATKRPNKCVSILSCFSLLRTTSALISTYEPPGAITCINGIRVISITWVIIGHFYQHHAMGGKTDNHEYNVKVTEERFSAQPIVNAFVCVDTFFVLSGLLFSYISLRKLKSRFFKPAQVLMMYVHRFIRLTPTLGVVILFWTNLYPLLVTGPRSLPITQTDAHIRKCRDYWWSVIFFFNNFYPEDQNDACLEWSWYLANDTQFYIVAPALLTMVIYIQRNYSNKKKAILLVALFLFSLCLVSMVITGAITGYYDIPGLVSRNLISATPRFEQAKWIVDRLYVKPYVRITPFLVGLFLGFLLHKGVTLKESKGKLIATVGWCVAIIMALLVTCGPWKVFKADSTFFTDGENVMYSATHRFVWSCCVAWVIFACHNEYGGFVNKFLSFKFWLPLSRLTYSVYLIHMIVMYFLLTVQEIPNHYQNSLAIERIIGITFITHAVAFVVAACVEYPIANLEKLLFGTGG